MKVEKIIGYGFAVCVIFLIVFGVRAFFMRFVDDGEGVMQAQVQEIEEPFMLVVEEGTTGPVCTSDGSFSGEVIYRILVDRETNVMYYSENYRGSRAAGASITPLYNPDGTLRIYNGD